MIPLPTRPSVFRRLTSFALTPFINITALARSVKALESRTTDFLVIRTIQLAEGKFKIAMGGASFFLLARYANVNPAEGQVSESLTLSQVGSSAIFNSVVPKR